MAFISIVRCRCKEMINPVIWCRDNISSIKYTRTWPSIIGDYPELKSIYIDIKYMNRHESDHAAVRFVFDNKEDKILFDLTWL